MFLNHRNILGGTGLITILSIFELFLAAAANFPAIRHKWSSLDSKKYSILPNLNWISVQVLARLFFIPIHACKHLLCPATINPDFMKEEKSNKPWPHIQGWCIDISIWWNPCCPYSGRTKISARHPRTIHYLTKFNCSIFLNNQPKSAGRQIQGGI